MELRSPQICEFHICAVHVPAIDVPIVGHCEHLPIVGSDVRVVYSQPRWVLQWRPALVAVRRESKKVQGGTGEHCDGQVAVGVRRCLAQCDLLEMVQHIVDRDTEFIGVCEFPDSVEGRQGDPLAGDGVEELDAAPHVRGHQPVVLPADPGPVPQPLGLAVEGLAGGDVVEPEGARLHIVLEVVAVEVQARGEERGQA